MMDIADLAWPRPEDIERDLLPLVKPEPKDRAEREELIEGLLALVWSIPNSKGGRWFRLLLQSHTKKQLTKIKKATGLLDSLKSEALAPIVQQLREFGDYEASPIGRRPEEDKTACVRLCREFLEARQKHAGIGDEGQAVKLAAAVWEFRSWSSRIREGDGTTPAAMSKHAKRGDKKKQKPR